MKLGSLFSGAGALDCAVAQVFGARTAWHCENDKAASKVLAHHWPGVPNLGDVTAVDWAQVEPVDILCGGWPCQPFSLAGKRKGADDKRVLWPEVDRAIRALRPRIIVLENVPAVLGPEFSRVASTLAACGYEFRWACLRASDVGAPHRRERLFILAADADRGGFEEFTERHRGPDEPGLSASQRDDAVRCGDGPVDLLPTPAAARSGRNRSASAGAAIRPSLDSIGALLPTPNASDGTGGGQHPDKRAGHSQQLIDHVLAPEQWGKYAPAISRWESLTRPAPSPTEPNRNGNPRLNPAFPEWMHGWPAGRVTDQAIGISRRFADVLLSLPGIAIVELPRRILIPNDWNDGCKGAWRARDGIDPVSAWLGGQVATPEGEFMAAAHARALAAALLAAAAAAAKAAGK